MTTPLPTTLLHLALAATFLLSLAALLTTTLLRRSSAATRHLTWTAATLTVLLLPAISLFPTPEAVPPELTPLPHLTASLPPLPASLDPASTPSRLPAPPSPHLPISSLLLPLYLLGLLLTLTPLLISPVLLSRLKHRSTPATDHTLLSTLAACRTTLDITRPTTLLLSDSPATMPLTFGLLRPHILLPADASAWPTDKLRLVLSHELAHIKRHDCLTHTLAQLARALHWFNPLAHLAVRRMAAERERACDDLVLAHTSARPSDYADTLLHLTASLRPAPALLPAMPMSRPSHLHTRLLAILNPAANRSPLTRRLTLAVLLLAPVISLPLACTPSAKRGQPHPAAGDLTVDQYGWTREMNACQGPMRDIALAAFKYAAKNDDRLPPTLGDTLPYVDRNSQWSPTDRRRATPSEKARMYLDPREHATTRVPDSPTKEWVNEHTSYTYLGAGASLGALASDDLSQTILLHDDLNHPHQHPKHGPMITCAFLDGHSEGFPLAQAKELIASSKAKLAAAAKGAASASDVDQHGWTKETLRAASNLRQLGQLILLYANDHNGLLPPNLGATLRYSHGDSPADQARPYLDPRKSADVRDPLTPDWINRHTSYTYIGRPTIHLHDLPDADTGPSTVILAHDNTANPYPHPKHGPVICALYADGHAELLPVPEAKKQIEQSRQTIANLASRPDAPQPPAR